MRPPAGDEGRVGRAPRYYIYTAFYNTTIPCHPVHRDPSAYSCRSSTLAMANPARTPTASASGPARGDGELPRAHSAAADDDDIDALLCHEAAGASSSDMKSTAPHSNQIPYSTRELT